MSTSYNKVFEKFEEIEELFNNNPYLIVYQILDDHVFSRAHKINSILIKDDLIYFFGLTSKDLEDTDYDDLLCIDEIDIDGSDVMKEYVEEDLYKLQYFMEKHFDSSSNFIFTRDMKYYFD